MQTQLIEAAPVDPYSNLYQLVTGTRELFGASGSPWKSLPRSSAVAPATQHPQTYQSRVKAPEPFAFDDVFLCSPFKSAKAPVLAHPAPVPQSLQERAPLSPIARNTRQAGPAQIYTPPHLRTQQQKSKLSGSPSRATGSPGESSSEAAYLPTSKDEPAPHTRVVKPSPAFGKIDNTPVKPELWVSSIFVLLVYPDGLCYCLELVWSMLSV